MSRWRVSRALGALVISIAASALIGIPGAASGTGPQYPDATGDSATAGDIAGITVSSDETSGQILFRISGSNLSVSSNSLTMLGIDSDANPSTGDLRSVGADYWFGVDDSTYDFEHWNGADWVETPHSSVSVTGGGSALTISVDKSELGNTSDFNFWVESDDLAAKKWDSAPEDGTFNYSLAVGGPEIRSVLVTTSPSAGPRRGARFTMSPIGLRLPPSGASVAVDPHPDSYSCTAALGRRTLRGSGTGSCTFAIPKKRSRGKRLAVTVTVTYEGASKSFPFAFKVR